ncbi:MAG: phospholipid carrier-dependent glycosyltransferase [Candidatus Aminicenantes bacterium]|nr:phospholipid carrier-dependent glycosyltransferase [Candidatus Aminicenantes bacterium]
MSVLWGGAQVVLLGAAALGYGTPAAFCLKAGETPLERFANRMVMGLGVVIMATVCGGWLRIWGPWFHHGLIAAGLLMLALWKPGPIWPRPLPLGGRNLVWAVPALAVLLFYAAFPPTFYDSLLYHLGVPAYYLQRGGFSPWAENFFSALPQNGEMLNLLLLSGGSAQGAKFLSLATAALLFLFLVDWAGESGLRHAWLPTLVFFSIPEALFLSATEKNDLLLMFFLLPAVRHLARSGKERCGWRSCAAAGILLGLAGGVKWQGLIIGAGFVAARVATSPLPLKKRLLQAALVAALVFVLVCPWLVKNQVLFANPVHPYLSGLFPSASSPSAQAREIGAGVRRGQDFSPGSILSFLRAMFLSPYSLGLTHVTGVIILLLLPLLALRSGLPGKRFLLAGCLLAFLLTLGASRVPRYFLPVFLALSIPLASGWEALLARFPRYRRLAFSLLLTLVAVQAIQAVALLERMTLGARYVLGKWQGTLPASARYLDIIPYHRAGEFINRRLGGETLTAFIGEERTFYIRRPFLASSSFDRNPALADLVDSPDAAAWAKRLRRRGVTHVLYCPQGLERMANNSAASRLQPSQRRRLEAFLACWPRVYDDGRYSIHLLPLP